MIGQFFICIWLCIEQLHGSEGNDVFLDSLIANII
jgi:hypothetical protein